ncbi:hypothetical protein CEXT_535631 [Caerostris extrusa]|uniref:Uncharacterized protein n=1 Tax=Caerostris extrusa TaxID=172846 RepID=A0AAV4M9F4_CAEEX|nr:hypothetical protein CEXT_535631 [Caerostris extrusa]
MEFTDPFETSLPQVVTSFATVPDLKTKIHILFPWGAVSYTPWEQNLNVSALPHLFFLVPNERTFQLTDYRFNVAYVNATSSDTTYQFTK